MVRLDPRVPIEVFARRWNEGPGAELPDDVGAGGQRVAGRQARRSAPAQRLRGGLSGALSCGIGATGAGRGLESGFNVDGDGWSVGHPVKTTADAIAAAIGGTVS